MKPGHNLLGIALLLVGTAYALAQPAGFNYDESKVPAYELPDVLQLSSGQRVTTAEQWTNQRRGEVLRLFEQHVYGRAPERKLDISFELLSSGKALGGKALRKQVRVHFAKLNERPYMDILLYLPQSKRPAPIFLGLNFGGNHSVHTDENILLSDQWMRPGKAGIENNRATEAARGTSANRWPIEMIVDRGYAVATIYYGDIDPDYDDQFQNGVHPLFYKPGQTKPAADEWGSIGAWAWGLSRAVDYFESDRDIDHEHVALLGHSRLGKTSLWAGAQDARFGIVISNNSGCGGAALSRRRFGETVKRINTSFPHWFCDNFTKFNDNETALPVDQHMLIALMAPRPVYVASAVEDRWADPHGEFLSAKHATVVYNLLGKPGISQDQPPKVDQPIQTSIGYHIRTGKHDVTSFDWNAYLDFADKHWN